MSCVLGGVVDFFLTSLYFIKSRGAQWCTSMIPAITWETETRESQVEGQPGEIPISKKKKPIIVSIESTFPQTAL